MSPELAKLLVDCARFAAWGAGQGICPIDGEPAEAPEEFLMAYSNATGFEDWEDLGAHVALALMKRADTQGGWNPIATAPKDCETVLTQHVDDLFPVSAFQVEGEWLRQTEGPEDIHGPGKWEPLYRAPTHWMPLPPSPGSST